MQAVHEQHTGVPGVVVGRAPQPRDGHLDGKEENVPEAFLQPVVPPVLLYVSDGQVAPPPGHPGQSCSRRPAISKTPKPLVVSTTRVRALAADNGATRVTCKDASLTCHAEHQKNAKLGKQEQLHLVVPGSLSNVLTSLRKCGMGWESRDNIYLSKEVGGKRVRVCVRGEREREDKQRKRTDRFRRRKKRSQYTGWGNTRGGVRACGGG